MPPADTDIVAARTFPARPEFLADVRDFVREQADAGDIPPEAAIDLLLAVSEACSNAALHSGSSELAVLWFQRDGRVRVCVRDHGVFQREGDRPDRRPTAGLGLGLMRSTMNHVTLQVGTEDSPGTVVWMEKLVHAPDGDGTPADRVRVRENA